MSGVGLIVLGMLILGFIGWLCGTYDRLAAEARRAERHARVERERIAWRNVLAAFDEAHPVVSNDDEQAV